MGGNPNKNAQQWTTMIESIRRKPVSKPKPYKDIRGKYKWVVYFYDVQKDVRAKKLFVDKLSADAFYEEKSFVEKRFFK